MFPSSPEVTVNPPPDPPPTTPLDYRTPSSPPPVKISTAIRGFFVGVAITLFVGFGFASVSHPYVRSPATASSQPVIVYPSTRLFGVFFLLLLVAALIGSAMLNRSRPANTYYLGLLIGVGVMALCEGLCFIGR